MARKLNWFEDTDEYGNTVWLAAGPYTEGFQWRLKQALRDNKPIWFEAHDSELLSRKAEEYATIEDAKADVEEQHANCIADNSA